MRAFGSCSTRMQSSSNCFYASFPHPPLVLIALLKCLTLVSQHRPSQYCVEKGYLLPSCSSLLFSLYSKQLLAFSQQHVLGVHTELFTSFNPQILHNITSFPEFRLLYWSSVLNLFLLECSFCIWLYSNRPSQPAIVSALRCKLSRPADFKCLSLVDVV